MGDMALLESVGSKVVSDTTSEDVVSTLTQPWTTDVLRHAEIELSDDMEIEVLPFAIKWRKQKVTLFQYLISGDQI
jgi:hypothetical protein